MIRIIDELIRRKSKAKLDMDRKRAILVAEEVANTIEKLKKRPLDIFHVYHNETATQLKSLGLTVENCWVSIPDEETSK